jgi:hypothetical protein
MTDWSNDELDASSDREPWPPSLTAIQINEDAVWEDLCDDEQWKPLQQAVLRFAALVRSPRMIGTDSLDIDEWNAAHATVQYEVDRLHALLLARQLGDALKDTAWEEPLASLLRGLDAATAIATQTARALSIEMNEEVLVESVEEGTVGTDDEESETPGPEWGRGYAYVLYRRYLADLQSILELRDAVCEEAYSDDNE